MQNIALWSIFVNDLTLVFCHLLPAVMCYDLWMPSIVFLLNKCHYLWGREKDAIASSDITKPPFVKQ